jgi:hypothetical protein
MSKKNNIDPRTGMDKDAFREDIKDHLRFTLAKRRIFKNRLGLLPECGTNLTRQPARQVDQYTAGVL